MEQSKYQDWYLTYDESILLKNKSFPHKLAFTVQLKQYLLTGTFPKSISDVTNGLASYLSEQLETNESILDEYDWSSRTAKRQREEILKFLGVEKPSEGHYKELIGFLVEDILPFGSSRTEIGEVCLKWFLEHKLAAPTDKVLTRTISTALSKFENKLFNQIAALLGRGTVRRQTKVY